MEIRLARIRRRDEIFFGAVIDGNFFPMINETTGEKIDRSAGLVFDFVYEDLLVPVNPTKIVAVGLNYRSHAGEIRPGDEEPEEPVLFIKPSTTVIGPDEEIVVPPDIGRVDYEAELAVVIKEKARNVTMEEAEKYILGYTCLNDVTARDLQKKDKQWTRAKGFDTFAPIGPWIVPAEYFDPSEVEVVTRLNGTEVQRGNTKDMIFPIPFLISYISRIMTLNPGDIISTGTPRGVGPIKPGDIVEVEVEGIGVLRNPVVKGPAFYED